MDSAWKRPMVKKALWTVPLLFWVISGSAESQDLSQTRRHYRLPPAEIVGPEIRGTDGKPLLPQRSRVPESCKGLDSETLLASVETLTREAAALVKQGRYQLAEERYKKALSKFSVLEKTSPVTFSIHRLDRAELLEGYADLLRETSHEVEALRYTNQAKAIRNSLAGRAPDVRTYSNGYESKTSKSRI